MSNKYRGEISMNLGSEKYVLRPSFQALCLIEEELNKSILDVLIDTSDRRLKITEMVSIIGNGIRAYPSNEKISDDDIGKSIYEAGLVNIMPQVLQFLERAVGIKNDGK